MARRTRVAAAAGVVGAGLVLALTGCSSGSGPVVSRDVEIDDVTAVELAAAGDLTISRGTTPSLTVTAPEGTQDRLVSEVRDGVLVLDARTTIGFHRSGDVHYDLVVTELTEVRVSGAGDVEGTDVTGDELTVRVDGSGDVSLEGVDAATVRASIDGSGEVELAGRSQAGDLDIGGSGSIDAEDLRLTEADVSIDGSGDVDVDVARRLGVAIGGSGTVRYAGDPAITSDIGGSGSVERL